MTGCAVAVVALVIASAGVVRATRVVAPGDAAIGSSSSDVVAQLFQHLDYNLDGKLTRAELFRAFPGDDDAGDASFHPVWFELFGEADTDGDGSLDMKEAAGLVDSLQELAASEDVDVDDDEEEGDGHSNELVAESPRYGDGYEDVDEYGYERLSLDMVLDLAWEAGIKPGFTEGVVEAFAAADLDHDGGLDGLEMDLFVELLDRHTEKLLGSDGQGDDVVDEHSLAELWDLDEDMDGHITLKELLDGAEKQGVRDQRLLDAGVRQFAIADADSDGRLHGQEATTFLRLLKGLTREDVFYPPK